MRALPDDKRSQIAAFISKLSTGETDDLVNAALAVLGREAAPQTPDRQPATADTPEEPATVPLQPEPTVTPEVAATTDRFRDLCNRFRDRALRPEGRTTPPTNPDERDERIRFLGMMGSPHDGVNYHSVLTGRSL